VYVEAAGGLARRIAAQRADSAAGDDAPDEDAARIEFGFRLVLARPAKETERALLLDAFRRERQLLRADKTKADKVLAAAKLTLAAGEDPAELAAWCRVATLLLNLDEAITKG
jgi:hypothetical protein